MATAPKIRASLLDPEIERSSVFVPTKTKQTTMKSTSTTRNPKDVIKRFEIERAYGLGRRRRKTRKVRKHRK